MALALFEPGEWMFAFDLKSGYHHTDIIVSTWGLNGMVNSTHLQYCPLGFHQHHMCMCIHKTNEGFGAAVA